MGVRSESVRLSLEDAGFSTSMAKNAAATMLLAKALDDLDGTNVRVGKSGPVASGAINDVGRAAKVNDSSINQLTGRLRLFADAAAILGPSLVPIGAVAIPAVSGLANQLGFTAVAAGTAVLAFQGFGDAMSAVNKASLDPTVENLKAAREALEQLSPAGQELVGQLQEMKPLFTSLRDTAAEGLFPGLIEGFESLERLAPRIEGIVGTVSETLGDLFADGAESLAGDQWADFFAMLEAEARPTLEDMGSALGSFVHGMSELWEAFAPLNRSFGSWLADVADGFDAWAEGLSATDGFREFVDYIETNGPRVADALMALGDALIQIIEAVAPLGGPSLQIIESFSKAIGTLADSEFGTPILAGVAALAALNRTMQVTAALQSRMSLSGGMGLFAGAGGRAGIGETRKALQGVGRDMSNVAAIYATAGARTARESERLSKATKSLRTNMTGVVKGAGPAAAAIGAFAIATADTENKIIGTNAAMGATIGLMGGGPWGAAVGAAVGNLFDLKDAYEQTADVINGGDIEDALDSFTQRQDALSDPFAWLTGETTRLGLQDTFALLKDGETHTEQLARAAARWTSTGASMTQMLRRQGIQVEDVNEETGGLTGALRRQERQTRQNEAAFKRFQDRLRANRDAAQAAAEGFADFSAKVKGGKFTLDGWLDKMEESIRAMRRFRQNAEEAARRGLDRGLIQHLREMGPEGALQLKRLADASEKEIGRANNMWRSFSRESRLAGEDILAAKSKLDALGRTKATPEINVDSNAEAAASAAQAAINRVTGKTVTITTYVDTVRRNFGSSPVGNSGNPYSSADGGTVPGRRRPYGDKVFAFLAPGEEGITNRYGEADRFRADRAAGRIPRYADGGTVTHGASAGGFGGDEATATSRAVRGLRLELKEATAALEKERSVRDRLVERMKTLSSDVQGGLRSELFSGDVWSGAGNGSSILRGDLANLGQMSRAIKTLKAKGLSGAALAEVLSQGGLQGALAYADMSRAELHQFEQLFNRRNRVLRSVGAQAGNAAYGAQYQRSSREYRELKAEVVRLRHAVQRNGKDDRKDHKDDRDAQQRGARRGARSRGRGQ